ncbi:TetR/AcrR family transcriptional regulator [Streptomyces eurocidicus]|uniref:AcrR family transcriptional regulator n=1 Tax=Streptomyces eurocidicus TaxID=66423 RepID=A0A7W8BBY2_STREU|nr:TetR/AcrR family transcriptional regulator [Streptomyces eurocidicus]MBB5118694.1 AcrR family transcriptional regulator [Streptomyces eurocidicus]MBF6051491.1 TetR family transcriptional regulator [Streptomyces eurocidicus]
MTTSSSPTTGPRARRRRLDENQRRAQIMTAAVEELADCGYDGLSLTRVAERAGVSKGLIWHYFADKDDLMESTAKATMTTIRDRIADSLDLTEPVPDIIRAALRRVAALTVTHQGELTALNRIVHNLRNPDGTPRLTPDVYEETYQAQESLFRRGQTEGTLRDFDTRVMAITYQGAIGMMLGYLGTSHSHISPDDYADRLADILLAGIRRS